jgi:peptidyl-prolyl cis-trans isomerase B (cyclophilin B)
VANFVKLVKARFYDGILVHRVEPGFVVQAGDPGTRGLSAKKLNAILARQADPLPGDPQIGGGGPGWTIPLEHNDLVHDRGVIAMARSSDPDSAGSQFYVTLGAAHFLDGQYAVFGKVTAGMDVVDKLAVGDAIRSARIIGE